MATTLYLNGVAYQLSYAHAAHKREKQSITRAHYAQLGLNYAWTILYFNLKLRKTSLIESYVLLAAGNITAHRFMHLISMLVY